MDDEIKRIKYRSMLNTLNRINNKLISLQESYEDDYEIMENNAKIDDEVYNKKEISNIGDRIDKIRNTNERLMNNLSNKI